MCFFFVLSGFVVMYTFEATNFSTWQSKTAFIQSRISRFYPIFVLNILCGLPCNLTVLAQDCWARKLCTALQLVMMDCWAGCGWHFTILGLGWYLSCAVWLWLAFPFIKNILVELFKQQGNIWVKMAVINTIWGGAFYLLWDYDIYTLSGVPLLRMGEFIIGCGAAYALKSEEMPTFISKGWHWILFLLIITFYLIQGTRHTLSFLCLQEESQHTECSLWHAGQTWVPHTPPCLFLMDKIPNKYAFIWASVIYGIARAELRNENTSGWVSRLLHADLFKHISSVSITLYLSHLNASAAIRWIGNMLLGWDPDQWRDDVLLLTVYLACYGLHHLMVNIRARLSPKPLYVELVSDPKDTDIQHTSTQSSLQ
jgi:hypothetical protein